MLLKEDDKYKPISEMDINNKIWIYNPQLLFIYSYAFKTWAMHPISFMKTFSFEPNATRLQRALLSLTDCTDIIPCASSQ